MNHINQLKRMNENMFIQEIALNELRIYFYIDDSTIDPEIYELLEIDESDESDLLYLKKVVLKYIDSKYFSINAISRNAICLLKDSAYRIYFVDCHGEKHLISEDEDLGRGIGIMANYAWILQYISKHMKRWRVRWNDEVLYAVKEILDVV